MTFLGEHVAKHSPDGEPDRWLCATGCDVVTVQRALGHPSASTTLNTYSHLWPTAEDRTRSAAGELLASALADCAD